MNVGKLASLEGSPYGLLWSFQSCCLDLPGTYYGLLPLPYGPALFVSGGSQKCFLFLRF